MDLLLALLLIAAALAVVPLLAVAVRRRVLQRGGGSVDLSLRARVLEAGSRDHGRGWRLGLGRFEGDCLRFYPLFSLAPRPCRALCRGDLVVQAQREPAGGERLALLRGAVVLVCSSPDGPVELALDRSAATGLLAWLESCPPGATLPQAAPPHAGRQGRPERPRQHLSARRPAPTARPRPGWRRATG